MAGGESVLNEIGDGRIVKMEVDYTETVDKAIPEAAEKAKAGDVSGALDQLMLLEKQSRLAADMNSNRKVQVAAVEICRDAKKWDLLNEVIVALTKKRGLIKQAVSKMVQKSCEFVDEMPTEEQKLQYIETLRIVTAGKIYVEVERARLTYKLVKMKEDKGEIDEACKLLLDLQIETYGSMEKQEKVGMLLEQMRLCVKNADFVRAQIISKKISTKFFDDTADEVQKLKLKYYELMIKLDENEGNYLDVCRHYRAVAATPIVKEKEEDLEMALKRAVIYICLAPHGNEQSDLLHRIKSDRNLEKMPIYSQLLTALASEELTQWQRDIIQPFEKVLCDKAIYVFDQSTEAGTKRWNDFQSRIVEHNIRMIAKYYTRITLKRMSQLLDWPVDKTESFLCEMVTNGTIPGAKIDRLSGVVRFQMKKTPIEALDDWANQMQCLMDSLNKANQLILKEQMVHRHLLQQH